MLIFAYFFLLSCFNKNHRKYLAVGGSEQFEEKSCGLFIIFSNLPTYFWLEMFLSIKTQRTLFNSGSDTPSEQHVPTEEFYHKPKFKTTKKITAVWRLFFYLNNFSNELLKLDAFDVFMIFVASVPS